MFTRTNKILILGRSGCGKTHLSKKIQEAYPRVWVFDTLKEYKEKYTVTCFEDFCEVSREILELNLKKYRVAIQLDPYLKNKKQLYDEMIKNQYFIGDSLIVTEEVQTYTTPHFMGHWLETATLTGRHQNIALLFTTQRVGLCHKTLASQCAHVFAGSTFEKNDLDYLRGIFGEQVEELKTIEDREFLHFQPGRPVLAKISNDLRSRS